MGAMTNKRPMGYRIKTRGHSGKKRVGRSNNKKVRKRGGSSTRLHGHVIGTRPNVVKVEEVVIPVVQMKDTIVGHNRPIVTLEETIISQRRPIIGKDNNEKVIETHTLPEVDIIIPEVITEVIKVSEPATMVTKVPVAATQVTKVTEGTEIPEIVTEVITEVVPEIGTASTKVPDAVTQLGTVFLNPVSDMLQICPSGWTCDKLHLSCKNDTRGIEYCICPRSPPMNKMLPHIHEIHCNPSSSV